MSGTGSGTKRTSTAAFGGRRSGISAYRRVATVLRRRIASGEWQPGDRLPPLEALVDEFRVGRVTVRHALDLLAEEGLIARHRDRRGSSVIRHPLDRRWFTLTLNLAELESHSASITVSEIDSGAWKRPLPVLPAEGRQAESYHRLVHLHHHQDFPYPIGITDLLIDRKLYTRLDGGAASDRPVLERLAELDVDLDQINQTFTIGEAEIDLAEHLCLHKSAPIAELRRIIRDGSDTIVYFGHLFSRGDLVRLDFSVNLRE